MGSPRASPTAAAAGNSQSHDDSVGRGLIEGAADRSSGLSGWAEDDVVQGAGQGGRGRSGLPVEKDLLLPVGAHEVLGERRKLGADGFDGFLQARLGQHPHRVASLDELARGSQYGGGRCPRPPW